MGKLVVSEFVSLDGVMEAPGGENNSKHGAWVIHRIDPAWLQYKLDEVQSHEALLIGRKTYETFAGAWPYRTGEFADKMNRMPKYVVSSTLKNPEWENTTVLQGDVPTAVAKLKKDVRGDLLVAGSHTLVQALRKSGLVDEYRLVVFPIVLGSGMRLFEETPDAAPLQLVSSRSVDNGVVILEYRPAAAAEGGTIEKLERDVAAAKSQR
jgi:dihydrofolate reductase